MSARRIRKKPINLWPAIAVLAFALVLFTAAYLLLLKPTKISCGLLLEKRDNGGSTINIKLGYDDKTKWIKVSRRLGLSSGYAYDVQMKGIVVKSIKACKSYTGKVYGYDYAGRQLELENTTKKLSADVRFYRLQNNAQQLISAESLLVGTTSSRFIEKNGIITAVIVGKPDLSSVRVGLTTSKKHSTMHTDLTLYSKRIITVKYEDKTLRIRDYALGIRYQNGFMELTAYDGDSSGLKPRIIYGRTKSRIVAYSDYPFKVPISFRSYDQGAVEVGKRHVLEFPRYYGGMEFSINGAAIKVVNDVSIDDYSSNVVLSKMNNLGDYPEAYSVQAVTARTFTASEILSGKYAEKGYHVPDTLPGMLYNPDRLVEKPEEITAAIASTSGIVMTYEKKLIDTKSYSTSCGVGAPYHQVFYEGSLPTSNSEKPYLSFANYSSIKIDDLSSEEAASNFLKDWTVKAYDSNSKYFRWKYELPLTTINKLIDENLYDCYKKDKNSFTKKWYFNIYRQADIPKTGIGKVTNLQIGKRGAAGNVLQLTLETETGEYRVARAENINKLLISREIDVDFLFGSSLNGFSTPPSSYFILEKELGSKTFIVYGGGLGHGVGMSQYGVVGMIRAGKSYQDILRVFYQKISLENWENAINYAIE